MKYCFLGFLALLFISCKGNKQQLAALLKEWEQKEIIFPSHTVFTIQGKDTVDFCIKDQYKVLVYTDSTGCTGCRLRLADWKKFMQQVDSTSADSVQFLFFFFPNFLLRRENLLLNFFHNLAVITELLHQFIPKP